MLGDEEIFWYSAFRTWINGKVVISEIRIETTAAGRDLDDVFRAEFRDRKAHRVISTREVAIKHLRNNNTISSNTSVVIKQKPVRATIPDRKSTRLNSSHV